MPIRTIHRICRARISIVGSLYGFWAYLHPKFPGTCGIRTIPFEVFLRVIRLEKSLDFLIKSLKLGIHKWTFSDKRM